MTTFIYSYVEIWYKIRCELNTNISYCITCICRIIYYNNRKLIHALNFRVTFASKLTSVHRNFSCVNLTVHRILTVLKHMKMVSDKPATSSNNPLEQFVLLAKSAKGAACLELIKQVLEAPGVHVFGELLDMPNVSELQSGPHSSYYNTLNLFAYGTYRQYIENKANLLDLSPVQRKKLQHLTMVTLATRTKCIPYSVLLEELDIKNVRDLEDLIIEAIYADIIHGKLDQKNSLLEIDYAIGRDIRPGDVGIIVSTLQDWCNACDAVLGCVEVQIQRANTEKNKVVKHKEVIEQEIVNIKKTLKTQAQSQVLDTDEAMTTDSREALPGTEKGKKPAKAKSVRSSGSVKLQR